VEAVAAGRVAEEVEVEVEVEEGKAATGAVVEDSR
jgi:hypothetical protein